MRPWRPAQRISSRFLFILLRRIRPVSGSSARLMAISAVTNYKPLSPRHQFQRAVVARCVRRECVLDERDAEAAAQAGFQVAEEDDRVGREARSGDRRRRRLGHEGLGDRKGRHALCPRLFPADRPDRREARQLPHARRRRRRDGRVHRQAARSKASPTARASPPAASAPRSKPAATRSGT